jgi:hypothetical protein
LIDTHDAQALERAAPHTQQDLVGHDGRTVRLYVDHGIVRLDRHLNPSGRGRHQQRQCCGDYRSRNPRQRVGHTPGLTKLAVSGQILALF